MDYGRVSRDTLWGILALAILYWVFEGVLYASMLGPLSRYADKNLAQNNRYYNFETGEELDEGSNVYVFDYSARWSTMSFSFQRPNQICFEYQLKDDQYQTVQECLYQSGFVEKETPSYQETFGEFVFYYREESANLQTLAAMNPTDKRLIMTCFCYKLTNYKEAEANWPPAIKSRLYDTPSYEYNMRSLEYKTRKYEDGKPAGIWKTQS